MSKVVEFEGLATGDGGCFCFEVDEETYRKIMGERDYQIELAYRREEPFSAPKHWWVYPMFGVTEEGKRYKVRVEVEEKSQQEKS